MHVLLIKEDKSIRNSITFLLDTEIGLKVTEAPTVPEALTYLLDETLKFDIVICDDSTDNQKIFKYLMLGDMQIRCLVLKDPKAPSLLAFPDLIAGYINPEKVTEELKVHFAERLNSFKLEPKVGLDTNYCRIRTETALQKSPLDYDVFVRLSAEKYVRVFKQGSAFTEKDMSFFLKKKQIEYLYFLKSDALLFANKLREELEKNFQNAAEAPEEETLAASAAQEAVMELGNRIGFTPEVQTLAKQGMMVALKSIGTGKPQLAQIAKRIMLQKDKYLGSHAILTSQIACSLATHLTWSSETTFKKLTFAAFFHDMIITNNKLAQIKTMDELKARKSEFTEDEYKKYSIHPAAISQMILTFSEVPADVNFIIAQHHEKPDGSGFPRGLTGPHIAPLSTVFIIAHDIVDYIFEHGNTNVESFLEDYRKRYSGGHFKKILAQLDPTKVGLGESPASATPPPASATPPPASPPPQTGPKKS